MLPVAGWAIDANSRIIESIKPGTIVFVGETHKKNESIQLVQDLVSAASERYECITLAVEIDDSQQSIIDQVVEGTVPVSAIKIPMTIDHPALREFIAGLATLKSQHSCFELIAIDTGVETKSDRDEWMAKRLSVLSHDNPVLVLLGNLHTLKRVNWTVSSGKPSVAEILDRKGFLIKSFVQRWSPQDCQDRQQRKSRFIDVKSYEALGILNNTIISLMNARPSKSADGVIDGLVVWECRANI